MRDFLDDILIFIGTTSLTNLEFEGIELASTEVDEDVYAALIGVLDTRESVSDFKDRLYYYFRAKGTDLNPPDNAKSNIFIGAVL